MELGDIKDSLLNMGNEKGKELADNYLDQEQEGGGLLATAAGFGKGLLGNVLGGDEQEADAGDNGAESSDNENPVSEDAGDRDNDSEEASSDDAPDADDNSDEDNNN